MYTFSNIPPVDLKNGSSKLGSAKANTKLFMTLQARHDADIDEFCKHENQREHPSLSDRGKLRQDTKSGIIGCLPGIPAPGHSPLVRNAKCGSRYGSSYTYHKTSACQYFRRVHTYAIDALLAKPDDGKYIKSGRSKDASLKSQTRAKRGETTSRRTRVSTKIPIPKGRQKFIKDCHNKVISVH